MSAVLGSLGHRRAEGMRLGRLPGILTMAAGIVSIVSVLLLIQTSGVASVGYDIQRLEEVRDHWRESNWQLEHEIASLKSLERVEREARTKLKMVPASQPVYVSVDVKPTTKDLTTWTPSAPPTPAVRIRPAEGFPGFLAWLAALGQGEFAP
jgi:cell division protein FtsL